MEDQYSNILDDFATKEARPERRALLPWWIKTFSWIFMVMGAFAIICFLIGFFGTRIELSLYGIDALGPQSAAGITIVGIFVLKAMTGFALWTEKDWAISLGLVDAVLGTAICLAMTIFSPWNESSSGFNIRLELLLLIPYLLKLASMQKEWAAARGR